MVSSDVEQSGLKDFVPSAFRGKKYGRAKTGAPVSSCGLRVAREVVCVAGVSRLGGPMLPNSVSTSTTRNANNPVARNRDVQSFYCGQNIRLQ